MKRAKQIPLHKIEMKKTYMVFVTTESEDPFCLKGSGRQVIKYLKDEFEYEKVDAHPTIWDWLEEADGFNGEGNIYYQVFEVK